MAISKVTPVVQDDGKINLKEGAVVEKRMTALQIKRARIEQEIAKFSAKFDKQLKTIDDEINQITETVVNSCRNADKNFTDYRLPSGINFLWSMPASAVYKLNVDVISKIPKTLYTKTLKYSPNTAQITTFIKNNGRLPAGITANKREGRPNLTLTGDIKAKLGELAG